MLKTRKIEEHEVKDITLHEYLEIGDVFHVIENQIKGTVYTDLEQKIEKRWSLVVESEDESRLGKKTREFPFTNILLVSPASNRNIIIKEED